MSLYRKLKADIAEGERKLRGQNGIDYELFKIAKSNSMGIRERGDLKTRNNDSEDFIEMPVWSIKQMLREAYKLGLQNK